jgi:hypothetical protein
MKKLLLLLALLFLSMPAYATYWYEYSHKAYVDLDSLKKDKNTAFVWVKLLNDGNINPVNNKKVWFTKNSIYIDLKNKRTALKDLYYYDLNNNVIETYTFDKIKWDVIVPDSMGEYLYQIVKKYPRFDKATEEELWVNVDETTKLDVFSLLMTNSQCCNMWVITYPKKPKKPNAKARYVKGFLSVNLVEQKFAILEAIEYNKNGKVVKVHKSEDLNYIKDTDDSLKPIIDYIYKLSNLLDKSSNPPLE